MSFFEQAAPILRRKHAASGYLDTKPDASEIPELSDQCLYSDLKASRLFDHAYAEFRKDVEGLKQKAASRFGRERIQEFLDLIDSAHHDSDNGWGDAVNEALTERGE